MRGNAISANPPRMTVELLPSTVIAMTHFLDSAIFEIDDDGKFATIHHDLFAMMAMRRRKGAVKPLRYQMVTKGADVDQASALALTFLS